MADFVWIPSFTAEKSHKHQVVRSKFEDYEQLQERGMNPVKQVWRLTFNNRKAAEAAEIESFLDSHRIDSFNWTPPRAGAPLKFRCTPDDWSSVELSTGFVRIQATFTQVFEP